MGSLAQKLERLGQTKADIRAALQEQGLAVAETEPFASYPGKIRAISSVRPEALEILTPPAKTSYAAGESFSLDGTTAQVRFSNGLLFDVDASALAFSPAGALTPAVKTVSIQFIWGNAAVSVSQAITVSKLDPQLKIKNSGAILDVLSSTASFEIEYEGDAAATVVSDNTNVAAVTISGKTVTAVSGGKQGSAKITVTLPETECYKGATKNTYLENTIPYPVLNDNSWRAIADVSRKGLASTVWSVGDTKEVHINGTVGSAAVDETLCAFIIGFNHNAGKEGSATHFQLGKARGDLKNIALTDASYESYSTAAGSFSMNPGDAASSTNTGGWANSAMRRLLNGTGNYVYPTAGTLFAALPYDLRSTIKKISKYTDNTGGTTNAESAVTATTDYLFLLSEFEVQGTCTFASTHEQNFQKQYSYYEDGNSPIFYRSSAAGSAARWWLRSPRRSSTSGFCRVGNPSGGNDAAGAQNSGYSNGITIGFCLG